MGKLFLFIFSIFNLFSFFSSSSCLSVFINLDEADFHKTFVMCGRRKRKRKFIKSAIKMISTSLFHPLIFSSFFFAAHPLLLRFSRKNALNTHFFHSSSALSFCSVITKVWLSLSWLATTEKKSYKIFFLFLCWWQQEISSYFTFFFRLHAKIFCALLFQRGFKLKYLSTFYVTGIFFFLSSTPLYFPSFSTPFSYYLCSCPLLRVVNVSHCVAIKVIIKLTYLTLWILSSRHIQSNICLFSRFNLWPIAM